MECGRYSGVGDDSNDRVCFDPNFFIYFNMVAFTYSINDVTLIFHK